MVNVQLRRLEFGSPEHTKIQLTCSSGLKRPRRHPQREPINITRHVGELWFYLRDPASLDTMKE